MSSEDHDTNGKFKKGNQAGTKSKRNKEIVAYIRSISDGLQKYIDMLDAIVCNPKSAIGDKICCIKELLDRSMGKSVMAVHQTGSLDIRVGTPEDVKDI